MGDLRPKQGHNDELEAIEIELLLEGIYRYYGFDFREYSPSFLKRRIKHRQHLEELYSISALQEKVLHDPSTLENLMDDFSIGFTEMFRDPTFFLSLRQRIIPQLRQLPQIKIWQAGCATGEETYSLAILLQEEGLLHKTKIYATDINEGYLEKSRKGAFSINHIQHYTQNYQSAGGKKAFSEYYEVQGDQVRFDPLFKEKIIFAHHNLVTDNSFNEFDLILCRNVLIYFTQKLRNRVHRLFHESLSMSGYLGLGKQEEIALSAFATYYKPIDSQEKLYQKIK